MNNHNICSLRDNSILESIDKYGLLSPKQVALLCVSSNKCADRIAQRRLKALFDNKAIRRSRSNFDSSFYYYLSTKPKLMEHTVMRNWYLIALQRSLKSWEHVLDFKPEDVYSMLRADLRVIVESDLPHTNPCNIFAEIDLSNNRFDKVEKYSKLYESQEFRVTEWGLQATRFPPVDIVTHRVKHVKDKINKLNKWNLEFRVYDIKKVKRGVLHNEL